MLHVRGKRFYLIYGLLFETSLSGCFNANLIANGQNFNLGPPVPSHLQSGAGTQLYTDMNGMPITPPFVGTAGMTVPFFAQVVDQYGNAIAPQSPMTINFMLLSGAGTIVSPTVVTNAQGTASTVYNAPITNEMALISASGFGPDPVMISVWAGPGVMNQFLFQQLTADVSTSDNIMGLLYAADVNGNVVSTYTGNPVNLTWNGFGPGLIFATADQGKKIFQFAPNIAGVFTPTATDFTYSGTGANVDAIGPSGGTVDTFTSAGGGWGTLVDWSLVTAPTNVQEADISANCTVNSNGTAERVSVDPGVTLTMVANTLTITGSDLTLSAGSTLTGGPGIVSFTPFGHVQEIFPSSSTSVDIGTVSGGNASGIALGSGTPITINTLTPAAAAVIYINGNVTVNNLISLAAANTKIQINPGATLNATAGISATGANAQISILGSGNLFVGNGSSIAVSGGGTLVLAGTAAQPAVVDVIGGAGAITVSIGAGGSLSADQFTMGHLANNGLSIAGAAGPTINLNHGTFTNIAIGNTVIDLSTAPNAGIISHLSFNDLANPGNLTPINAGGLTNYTYVAFGSLVSGYEIKNTVADPSHLLIWDH